MQIVNGIYIPERDTHFHAQIMANPIINGRGTYQYKKIMAALETYRLCRADGRVALDIGAHVGLWTRILAQYFTMVEAFEPALPHIECFQHNLRNVSGVVLHPCALGNQNGIIGLDCTDDNTGAAHIDEASQIMVPIRLLDSFNTKPDFIKIDVEGYEIEIVRGGEYTIRKHKPIIVIEQKGRATRYGGRPDEALDLLLSWGMKVMWEIKGDFCLTW